MGHLNETSRAPAPQGLRQRRLTGQPGGQVPRQVPRPGHGQKRGQERGQERGQKRGQEHGQERGQEHGQKRGQERGQEHGQRGLHSLLRQPALPGGLAGLLLAAALLLPGAPALARPGSGLGPAEPAAGEAGQEAPSRLSARLAEARSEQALSVGAFYLTANAALVSEYRFRGVRLSGGRPAAQANVEFGLNSGFYVGGFASTIDQETLGYGATEFNTFAGWSGPLGGGLTADLGAIAYLYPDAPLGDANYFELYGSLAYQLGPAQLSVGGAFDPAARGLAFVGPRGVGLIRDNLYLHSDFRLGLPGTGLSLKAHAGYTDGWRATGGRSPSFDWSVGAEMPLSGPLTLGLAYVDATSREPLVAPGSDAFDPLAAGVVATLRIGI